MAFPVHADPDQHCTEDCGYHGGAGTNNNPNYGESGQGSGQARQNAKSYLRSQGLNLSDAEADKALYSACGVGQMPKGLTAGQYATIFYGANKYLCP